MNGRHPTDYSDYGVRGSAAEIARECIIDGKSQFWKGSKENFDAVSEILKKLNIAYVDDFYGEWRIVNPKK